MDLYRGLQEGLLPRDAPLLLILHGIVGAPLLAWAGRGIGAVDGAAERVAHHARSLAPTLLPCSPDPFCSSPLRPIAASNNYSI